MLDTKEKIAKMWLEANLSASCGQYEETKKMAKM